jgi:hypothetical protein
VIENQIIVRLEEDINSLNPLLVFPEITKKLQIALSTPLFWQDTYNEMVLQLGRFIHAAETEHPYVDGKTRECINTYLSNFENNNLATPAVWGNERFGAFADCLEDLADSEEQAYAKLYRFNQLLGLADRQHLFDPEFFPGVSDFMNERLAEDMDILIALFGQRGITVVQFESIKNQLEALLKLAMQMCGISAENELAEKYENREDIPKEALSMEGLRKNSVFIHSFKQSLADPETTADTQLIDPQTWTRLYQMLSDASLQFVTISLQKEKVKTALGNG